MTAFEPTSENTVAVLLGAQHWPRFPSVHASPALASSSSAFEEYLRSSSGMKLPPTNIKNLFDDERSPSDLLEEIKGFLKDHHGSAVNLLVHYVGHGAPISSPTDYRLLLRYSDISTPDATTLTISHLSEALRTAARTLRWYIIIDACLAGLSILNFQAPNGVAILCASNSDSLAKAPKDATYTMFTGAMLDALRTGDGTLTGSRLSLRQLNHLVAQRIEAVWGDMAVRPAIHSPDQRVADLSEIGFFPNQAKAKSNTVFHIPTFHYGSVVTPNFFIGREDELRHAHQLIHDGHGFLLVGNRRSGKTSFYFKLIHELKGSCENNILPAYLNLQNCRRLTTRTFLEHTLLCVIGEVAREIFNCKYTEILDYDAASSAPHLENDSDFAAFVKLFTRVKTHTHSKAGQKILKTPDFIALTQDLLRIIRAKQWDRCVVFYDEANRLPHNLSVDILTANQEALTAAGLHSVYAASPEMEVTFRELGELLGHQVELGPFRSADDLRRLLERYYFDGSSDISELPTEDGVLSLLWKYSGGMPYAIQWLAGESFRLAHKNGASRVSIVHVEEATNELKRTKPTMLINATR